MVNSYNLDFTGIQSTNYIPEGIHTVKISGAEFKKAQTGSDQLQVTFEDKNGAIRSAWFSLVPQALWKVKGFLETLGIPCDGKITLTTATLKGKMCSIVVEPDENDSSKLVITKFNRVEQASTPVVNYASQPAVEPPVAAPVVTPNPAPVQVPQGNLPPWMQATQSASPAPQGNLPPWMTQK